MIIRITTITTTTTAAAAAAITAITALLISCVVGWCLRRNGGGEGTEKDKF